MNVRDLFSNDDTAQDVLSVWELTSQIKSLMEGSFPSVWVSGEVSNLARPRSGHCYLTLKDDRAQLRAAIWRNAASRLQFDLQDGLEVVCRGHVDVYAPRGSYQLIIEQIEPKGIGALELAFRQLREKLAKEGLFDPDRKRPLPRFVRRIAVVTSPTGAAIHDFLQVLGRRWQGADVLLVPVRVQGKGAAEEIAEAIKTVNRLAVPVDCLVVTRGGGSLEDLWAFNEEPVVRAVYASDVPVISAIGHEIDVTLCDLVADVRALTPSEAAELVAPASDELVAALQQFQKRLSAGLRSRAVAARSRLDAVAAHPALRRPYQRIHDLTRRLDELEGRFTRSTAGQMQAARNKTDALAAQLESLSPLRVLGRGYSVTQRTADGKLVRRAAELSAGEEISTRFATGLAISRVERIED